MAATPNSSLQSQKLGMAFLISTVCSFSFSSSARQRATIIIDNNTMAIVGVHYSRTQFFLTNRHWCLSGCPCPTDEKPEAQGTRCLIEDQSAESQARDLSQYNIPNCSAAAFCSFNFALAKCLRNRCWVSHTESTLHSLGTRDRAIQEP